MNALLALPALAALVWALVVVRRIARREKLRRYQLRRSLNRSSQMGKTGGRASARSEMRAYGDPTSVMEQIKKAPPPAEGGMSASAAPQTDGRDTTRSRTKHKHRH
jgi:hypothetical protein